MNKFILLITVVLLASAAPVFACSGCGCQDKDKDTQVFMPMFQTLCGGDKDHNPVPNPNPQCGGDKGDKPAPEPAPLCGGTDNQDKKDIKA